MSWSYSAGVLTSAGGATKASPDSLLGGIAVVQAADSSKGYVSNYVGWLNDVEIRIATDGFVRIDADAKIELRGSSYINLQGSGSGIIHGNRSVLHIRTTTSRIDTACDIPTGATFIAQRESPYDPSPQIVYQLAARHDYPNIQHTSFPAEIDIAGMDFYSTAGSTQSFIKLFFGNATTATAKNVRVFGADTELNGQFYNVTLDTPYFEALTFSSAPASSTATLNSPTYYLTSAAPLSGFIRECQITLRNPTFLNSCWNQAAAFNTANVTSKFSLVYTFRHTFRVGLTAVQSVACAFVRSRQSVNGSPSWTAAGASASATSDVNGTYTAIDLIDAYREGTSSTDLERFKWACKARKYDRRTPSEFVFENRVLFVQPAVMAAGFVEDVQMLAVEHLTLTEAQAAALTGIALTPSGATGGTLTVSANRTIAEVWHYYRQWIAQAANIMSAGSWTYDDTWAYDGATLDVGAWNITVNTGVTLTGNVTTSGSVTLTGTADVDGVYTDSGGRRVKIVAPNIVNGSRVQLYNLDTSTELLNAVLSSAGVSHRLVWATDQEIRLRADHADKLALEVTGLLTSNGLTFLNTQEADTVYTGNAIDGSTVTEFDADEPNVQIDLDDPDGVTTWQRLYAWFQYWQTTSAGIASSMFGALTAQDSLNYLIDQDKADIKFDNVSGSPVVVGGGYGRRKDGTTLIAATSDSIQMDPGRAYSPLSNATDVADAVLAGEVETGHSLARAIRIIAAAVAGKTSGGPTSFVARDLTDSRDQISGSADSSGNRTSATYGA